MARAQQTNPAGRSNTKQQTKRTTPASSTRGQAPANRTMKQQAAARTATTNRTTPATSTPASSTRGQAGATNTSRAAPAKRKAAAKTAGKRTQTKREAMEGPGGRAGGEARPALRLTPIRTRQSRTQIIATVAADTGVERPIVERVARSLSTTLTRHLIRNGSGRVEIPYLGAALWRGRQAARKARKMASPFLEGRIVTVPGRQACPVPRLRAHQALRDTVARG